MLEPKKTIPGSATPGACAYCGAHGNSECIEGCSAGLAVAAKHSTDRSTSGRPVMPPATPPEPALGRPGLVELPPESEPEIEVEDDAPVPVYPSLHPGHSVHPAGGPLNPLPAPGFSRVAEVFAAIAPKMTQHEKEECFSTFVDEQRLRPSDEEREAIGAMKGDSFAKFSVFVESRADRLDLFARFLKAKHST